MCPEQQQRLEYLGNRDAYNSIHPLNPSEEDELEGLIELAKSEAGEVEDELVRPLSIMKSVWQNLFEKK